MSDNGRDNRLAYRRRVSSTTLLEASTRFEAILLSLEYCLMTCKDFLFRPETRPIIVATTTISVGKSRPAKRWRSRWLGQVARRLRSVARPATDAL